MKVFLFFYFFLIFFVCFCNSQLVNINKNNNTLSLREWPYENWLYGPPCKNRYNIKLLPISLDLPELKLALDQVRLLCEIFTQQLYDLNIPVGFSVGITYNQQTLFSEGFGSINKNTNTPPSDTTIYNIGSVTKIFTSLAFYHSVEQGLVKLTDPVTKFFNSETPPVFSIHNPYSSEGSNAVTLHSLASQASGLPREAYCGAYPITLQCKNNTYAAKQNMEYLSNFGLLFSPFTGTHYSNLGLSLLGRSLERVWNELYEDFMVDNIFPNIGMPSTGFTYTKDVINNMATGYIVEGPFSNGSYITIPAVSTNTEEFGWSAPAGGAYSSRSDMLSFFKWIFGNHTSSNILSQSFLDEYISPGILMPNAIELYSQGTWETFYANGYWALTKGGLTSSMGTSISLVPALKLGISVMLNINSGIDADSLNSKINAIMVPVIEDILSNIQEALPLPSNYEIFLGTYGLSLTAQFFTIKKSSTTDTTGILEGSVVSLGDVNIIWDSAQDYSTYTAFRYSSTKQFSSCMSLSGSGNNGIAYFQIIEGEPQVTLADQNGNFYNMSKLF